MNDKGMSWGMALRLFRELKDITAKELSGNLKIPYTTYMKWESGERRITLETAALICKELGWSLDQWYALVYNEPLLKEQKSKINKMISHKRDMF